MTPIQASSLDNHCKYVCTHAHTHTNMYIYIVKVELNGLKQNNLEQTRKTSKLLQQGDRLNLTSLKQETGDVKSWRQLSQNYWGGRGLVRRKVGQCDQTVCVCRITLPKARPLPSYRLGGRRLVFLDDGFAKR